MDVNTFPIDPQMLSAEQRSFISGDPDAHTEYERIVERATMTRARENMPTMQGIGSTAATATAPQPTSSFVVRSYRRPETDADKVRSAMMRASATKVRDLTKEERDNTFAALCDHLGVPETEEDRDAFYYSVIGWIYVNTASIENGVESLVDRYSSADMLSFFGHDMRPFSRALADDAYVFVNFVCGTHDHEMHEVFVRIAIQCGCRDRPHLAYDGMDRRALSAGDYRLYISIKRQRLAGDGVEDLSAAEPTRSRQRRA